MTTVGDPTTAGRVIVLDVVGLQQDHLGNGNTPNITTLLEGGLSADLQPPMPAVTVPAQTTLATGQSPATHGDIANGEYDRETDTVAFWERDRADRTRLWEAASEAGFTTGALFFQHLIGTTADVAVTPSPIEDEDNNLLEMNCWTNPDGFYDDLEAEYGHFPLHHYWGPGANEQGSEWILTAARETIERYDPDLLWVYVPHLDYDGQRYGPGTPEFTDALETVDRLVGEFLDFLREDSRWDETAVNIVSEYGFHSVDTPVFPNRALRDAGLLSVDSTDDHGDEVNIPQSQAFAMVDHQVAHVYVEPDALPAARRALKNLDGIASVLEAEGKEQHNLDHPNAGDLVLIAEPAAWFQYYWWTDQENAPTYATDMDIHAKPGYDPCELFFGDTGLASLDPSKVRGSHGRVDDDSVPLYGLGGPAAPEIKVTEPVDARAVAPTVFELLGIDLSSTLTFDVPGLVSPSKSQ
ncbi:alkaline phosphatase family protein [Haloarcula amylovorans]|uniref:alkaline phosphatase family protein n=1 Tax=Haloarcula amylovorans TaxID=2562280 RepID=UPI001075EAD2|nr:nucleotide pyrophosphatase/phosphodiesterase family protein [Halomicroarcula amylolytica]